MDCPDPTLRVRLAKIFTTPLRARRALGGDHGFVSYEVCEIPPHTADFFEEIVYLLRKHDLAGKLYR